MLYEFPRVSSGFLLQVTDGAELPGIRNYHANNGRISKSEVSVKGRQQGEVTDKAGSSSAHPQ